MFPTKTSIHSCTILSPFPVFPCHTLEDFVASPVKTSVQPWSNKSSSGYGIVLVVVLGGYGVIPSGFGQFRVVLGQARLGQSTKLQTIYKYIFSPMRLVAKTLQPSAPTPLCHTLKNIVASPVEEFAHSKSR